MPLPETRKELEAKGYEFLEDGTCRGCGELIEWFLTPNGKRMPVSRKIVGSLAEGNRREILESHFASCPDADRFRKRT